MLTFYGHFSGPGSYVVVSRAIARELRHWGIEFTVVDLRSEEMSARAQAMMGTFQPCPDRRPGTALLFGFPEWNFAIPRFDRMIGYHVCDLDRVPPYWVPCMEAMDLILTPSTWCADIFREAGLTKPVQVVHHGVDDAYFEAVSAPRNLGGHFSWLHYCSSQVPHRKGTPELLKAWKRSGLADRGDLLYVSSPLRLPEMKGVISVPEDFVEPEDQAIEYRSAHVVVQPSRAEGFGCIPLEAACAGVPIVSTGVTGHWEWFSGVESIEVPTGPLEPCLPGPGRAPSLDPDDLARALLVARDQYDILLEGAVARLPELREQWSWSKVLEPLRELLS